LLNKPARVAAVTVAGSALMVSAWPAMAHWMAETSHPSGHGHADVLGMLATGDHQAPARQQPAASPAAHAIKQPDIVSIAIASRPGQGGQRASPGYVNPLRGVSGLVPERIDEGVDFSGSGPVYALGDAVITHAAFGYSTGWPGGGWITYQLTDGPEAGLMVYVAEDVKPVVQVGQHVSPSTLIATMFAGGDGIETGWAQPSGLAAESELPEAGGIGGNGPFPARVGVNFDELLQSLGVPAAPNSTQPAYGVLPANYLTNSK
jgi:hypothetical protein